MNGRTKIKKKCLPRCKRNYDKYRNPAPETDEDEPIPDAVDVSDEESESDTDCDTDDEENLHGPCGDKVCGADPPPKPSRDIISMCVSTATN